MPRVTVRTLLWIAAIGGLGLVAVIVVKAIRWKPAAAKRQEAPTWELEKSDADPDLFQAIKLQGDGKDLEALALFDKALARNPDDWVAVAGRANCYEALHRDAEALAALRRLAELQPRSATPWVRIANTAIRTGDKKLAREAAERAMRVSPDLADPYLVLGDLAADTDLAQSVTLLEEYLRRAWNTDVLDDARRKRIENTKDGTYIKRLIALHLSRTPEGPSREAHAEMEAHWYAAHKYMDFAAGPTRYKTLEHVMSYFRLARGFGDPNRDRFAKAREMIAKLKADIRAGELLKSDKSDAGAPGLPE